MAFGYLDGRHSRLKAHVNIPQLNVWVVIDLLGKEHSLGSIAKFTADTGASIPEHRKNKVTTDKYLIKLWQRFDEGRLDIFSFLRAAGFQYLQRSFKR